MENLSYILMLRNALQAQYRTMPLFQNGSAIIVMNDRKEILMQRRADRNQWGLPGGLQELGETFEEVAVRELKEETGLQTSIQDLRLIGVVSGESRKNIYPNGDIVYNNTVLYETKRYSGTMSIDYQELVDNGVEILQSVETLELRFFALDAIPTDHMDDDLIKFYIERLNI